MELDEIPERVSWPRAWGFAAVAIATPFAVGLALLALIDTGAVMSPLPPVATLGSASAAASVIALALLAHRYTPRSRMACFGFAMEASGIGTGTVLVALSVAVAIVDGLEWALHGGLTAAVFAVGVFFLIGGPLWLVAGAHLAAPALRIAPEQRLRAPGVALTLGGALLSVGALSIDLGDGWWAGFIPAVALAMPLIGVGMIVSSHRWRSPVELPSERSLFP